MHLANSANRQFTHSETTISTDEAGSQIVITRYLTSTASSAPIASAAGGGDVETTAKSEDKSVLSIGAIIGIAVAAGLVVISLVGCAVWRMKRRHGDEDEAIRWSVDFQMM